MTTEVLFTPTPSSSSNGQMALIRGKGGEQFENGGDAARRSRRNLSGGGSEMSTNCQRNGTPNGKGRRTSGDSESAEKDSPKTIRSPRCEAFVMTGEKMLSLNPKISPCYAKMCQNQLPPTVEVDSPPRQQPTDPFDAFPSQHRSGDRERQRIKDFPPPMVAESFDRSEIERESGEAICDKQQTANNGGEAIETEKGGNERTEGAEEGGRETTTSTDRMPSTSHGSKSTPTTPSKEICETKIRKKHREEMASETIDKRRVTDGEGQNEEDGAKRNAIGKCQNGEKKARKHRKVSARSSDILTWTNSQQSVAYPTETIAQMARHFFTRRDGFKGTKISAILVQKDELSLRISCEFLALFNFAGLRIDVALRDFLGHVQLCGDICQRERLLEHFAKRYFECNPTVFNSADDVRLLASALILLSADLHGTVVRNASEKAMSCREFIDNLSHSEHNKFDTAMLRELYVGVSERPINWRRTENDETEGSVQSSSTDQHKFETRFGRILSSKRRDSSVISELKSDSLAGTMVDPEHQVDYKHGWLFRKSIYDADGKRTPFGRRKWLMHYVTVRGMVLYLHQNEQSFSSACRYVTFRNCILLHHAFAEPCCDYTKRRNVFRLRTAQLGESLFQTSESAEVQCWCDAINYVAAAFSTPALPAPVGANGLVGFYRPRLPSTATHLSIPDQLGAHEQRMEETALSLARLREKAPPMKAKGRVVHEYFYKERFLETEKNRYAVYVSILRDKLTRASSVLRSGGSFASYAVQNIVNPSVFEEMSRGGRPCSSVTSTMDTAEDQLPNEDGTIATTTTADIANVDHTQPNKHKKVESIRQHQSRSQRFRAKT
ncbi:hypothetical protein niasHT_015700 [Heterodera trifolii]|uniref:PH and SEC7 domain-containing protein 1 n=1 Tax=Heterodera trifolii TaxID=157864 RepID=A0ABD2L5A2_9BILA